MELLTSPDQCAVYKVDFFLKYRSREELVNNDGNGADLPLEARLTARPGDGIAEDPVPPAILRYI